MAFEFENDGREALMRGKGARRPRSWLGAAGLFAAGFAITVLVIRAWRHERDRPRAFVVPSKLPPEVLAQVLEGPRR